MQWSAFHFLAQMERKSDMRRPCITGFRRRVMLALSVFILGIVILYAWKPVYSPFLERAHAQCPPGHPAGFLSTLHGELVDASKCEVHLTGVNWFGFETSTFAPHGLQVRNYQDMLKQMVQLGFNTIRLPYTNQLFDPASKPQGINFRLNPDLKGLQGLALMDRIIQGAGRVGLKVILDRHDPTADQRPPLWYSDQMPQTRWIQDWVM